MNKRVAVVADVMMSYGGAEVVTELIMEMYPEADFYTLFFTPAARKRFEQKFPKAKIHVSCWQKLVRSNQPSKYISIIKLFLWVYWEKLNLENYDLVISSSHSFGSKAVRTKGKHVSYVHTPPRYLYEEYNEIGWFKSWIFGPIRLVLRWIDKNGSKRPDVLVANSENVARRIKKYYGREAVVVYPPVEVLNTIYDKRYTINERKYFICLSRLVKQKGIELAVRTCVENNWKLVVIGNGPELANLRKVARGEVEFVTNADDKEKCRLLAGARALIYTSINEDWGIVPVEAMALGVPVIAHNSGGVRETVVEGKTGVFFDVFSDESLKSAIDKFDKIKFGAGNCRKQAEKFSKKIFINKIKNVIRKTINVKRNT